MYVNMQLRAKCYAATRNHAYTCIIIERRQLYQEMHVIFDMYVLKVDCAGM